MTASENCEFGYVVCAEIGVTLSNMTVIVRYFDYGEGTTRY